jgi:hypothetical protein
VIVVDFYDAIREPLVSKKVIIIQEFMNAVHFVGNVSSPRFILSIALTIPETLSMLHYIGIKVS